MDYITKTQLEQYSGLQIDNTLEAFLDLITESAKNYIDLACSTDQVGQRWFDDDDTPTTRYFDGKGLARLYVDDLREVTNLQVFLTAASGVALTLNTDYFLYPLNAPANGFPYEYIELVNPAYNLPVNSRIAAIGGVNPYVFYTGQRNVIITGKWGFNKEGDGIPGSIKMAMLKICTAFIKENIGDTDLKEVTAESLGEYSASYAKIKDIADRLEIASLLAPFKRALNTKGGGNRLLS